MQAENSCAASTSARRVLKTSSSYNEVCTWLDQQVSRREGQHKGQLVAACSHACLDLDPVLEPPITPALTEASEGLPAPAFQLLGLL